MRIILTYVVTNNKKNVNAQLMWKQRQFGYLICGLCNKKVQGYPCVF